jgi:hypothetical protein
MLGHHNLPAAVAFLRKVHTKLIHVEHPTDECIELKRLCESALSDYGYFGTFDSNEK